MKDTTKLAAHYSPRIALQAARLFVLPGPPMAKRQITVMELDDTAPFEIQRIYWIHSLKAGELRGQHAHRTMQQLLIAMSGSFSVTLDDGISTREFRLDSPTHALLVPPGLWRNILTLEEQSTLLALASTHFDEADYIRDYPSFLAYVNEM